MKRNLLIWLTLLLAALTTPILSSAAVMVGSDKLNSVPLVQTERSYTIQPGDTLWKVSNRLGISINRLMSQNHISNPKLLQIGKALEYVTWNLPGAAPSADSSMFSGSTPEPLAGRSVNPLDSPSSLPYTKVLNCTLTAYTAGMESTGKSPGQSGYGITSTGSEAEQGVTVAVDPNVIPYGTKLFIPGVGYRLAQDTGGAIRGDHIDIFYSNRSTAVKFGVKQRQKVYILPDWFHFPD